MKNKKIDIIDVLHETLVKVDLTSAKTTFDQEKGSASIYGYKDGYRYTLTINPVSAASESNKTSSAAYSSQTVSDPILSQIIQLRQDGLTQRQIGEILGIAQPTVSKYLKAHREQ